MTLSILSEDVINTFDINPFALGNCVRKLMDKEVRLLSRDSQKQGQVVNSKKHGIDMACALTRLLIVL